MGSIDENAIQNLSLVVNLTKNIQFKANSDDDTEIEDYSSYFPTFVWIIRDFTLQLVDQVIIIKLSKNSLSLRMVIQLHQKSI